MTACARFLMIDGRSRPSIVCAAAQGPSLLDKLEEWQMEVRPLSLTPDLYTQSVCVCLLRLSNMHKSPGPPPKRDTTEPLFTQGESRVNTKHTHI